MDDKARRNGKPWPVNASEYPLNGPSEGPMYLPPVPVEHRFNVFTFALKCALIAFLAFWFGAFFEYFFIPN